MQDNPYLAEISQTLKDIKHNFILNEKEILTPEEAAVVLGISLDSLHFYTSPNNTVIPHTGFGKHKRFLRSELIKWLKEMQTNTPFQLLNHLKEMDKKNGSRNRK